ncbi:MAG: flagellar protein FlgN [Phycisphaeraceae bacterium]|nr:flagellar protein FlgN [Phycisphaeraceae bacterium]
MTRAVTQPNAVSAALKERPDPITELDSALRDLVADHEALLNLARAHREAIAKADVSAMHRCLEEQQERLQRIRGHEFRRRAAVVALQGAVTPDSGRLSALAQRATEPVRSRLVALGDRLRELLNALQIEHEAVRQAAETLSSHMEGLMRQVCRHLSHAGTYGPTAAIDTRTPVVTVLDLRR